MTLTNQQKEELEKDLISCLAREIPLDIFPLKISGSDSPFLSGISRGATLYER